MEMEKFLPQSDIQLRLDEIAMALLKGQANIVQIESACDGVHIQKTYTLDCLGSKITVSDLDFLRG